MATAVSQASELFRQAIQTFQSAIKTGVKTQEESVRWMTQIVRDLGSPAEWQKNAQAMINEAILAAQRNVDESIRLMNHGAQTAMNLLQQAFELRQGQSTQEWQASGDEFWETALGALRTNTQVILQANARALESWVQLAKEVSGRMEQEVPQPQQQA